MVLSMPPARAKAVRATWLGPRLASLILSSVVVAIPTIGAATGAPLAAPQLLVGSYVTGGTT